MRKLLLLFIVSLVAMTATAQKGTSIGVKIGSEFGVSFNHAIGQNSAMQYDLAYQIEDRGVMLTAIYQKFIYLATNLDLYIGGGLNAGYINPKYHDPKFIIGITPAIGLQYSFANSPVTLALGYQPHINLTAPPKWNNVILGVRFAF